MVIWLASWWNKSRIAFSANQKWVVSHSRAGCVGLVNPRMLGGSHEIVGRFSKYRRRHWFIKHGWGSCKIKIKNKFNFFRQIPSPIFDMKWYINNNFVFSILMVTGGGDRGESLMWGTDLVEKRLCSAFIASTNPVWCFSGTNINFLQKLATDFSGSNFWSLFLVLL